LTSGAFQPGVTGLWDFEDFDTFAAASPGWIQRHQQLGRGAPSVRLVMAQTAGLQLAVVRRATGVRVEGVPPRDSVAFGVALGGDIRVNGELYGPGRVASLEGGSAFEVHAPHPNVSLTMSAERGLFERLARGHGNGWSAGRTAEGPMLLRDESARRALVATWCAWIARARKDPTWLTDPVRARVLEEAAVSSLLEAVDPGRPRRAAAASQRSARVVEETLRANLRNPLVVYELADSLGMSRRTLHASFVRHYGISPKAYHQALRLDAARNALRRAEPGVKVADVAIRWSFFHLGRFSLDYRRAFGESPSETLRRSIKARTAATGE